MMMIYRTAMLLLLLSVTHSSPAEIRATASIDPNLVPTNPSRTSNVNHYCSSPRSTIVTNDEIVAANSNHKVLAAGFRTDG